MSGKMGVKAVGPPDASDCLRRSFDQNYFLGKSLCKKKKKYITHEAHITLSLGSVLHSQWQILWLFEFEIFFIIISFRITL
jgi:hypothetical protein